MLEVCIRNYRAAQKRYVAQLQVLAQGNDFQAVEFLPGMQASTVAAGGQNELKAGSAPAGRFSWHQPAPSLASQHKR